MLREPTVEERENARIAANELKRHMGNAWDMYVRMSGGVRLAGIDEGGVVVLAAPERTAGVVENYSRRWLRRIKTETGVTIRWADRKERGTAWEQ